jgi:hypothetical protein
MDAQQQRGKYKYVDATSGFNGQRGWGYQTCTEVFQPMPTNGVTDMLLPSTPNKTALFESCEEEVKKTRPFLRHSTVKMIILPRQARYKHRESSRKRSHVFSSYSGGQCLALSGRNISLADRMLATHRTSSSLQVRRKHVSSFCAIYVLAYLQVN